MTETPVTRKLDQLGIPYRLYIHETQLRSLEQAASERGLLPEQIVRSLLFRLEDGSYLMVLMPGPEQVAWPKLRHYLGVSRLTTAAKDEVEAVTGFPPGAVSPFGLTHPVRILADERIKEQETISMGAGIRNAGIIMTRRDLTNALDLEWGDFCEC
jgi:Cys-tRNA(Pro) deacylase